MFTSLCPQHGLLFHGALRPKKPQGLLGAGEWRWGNREIICCDLSLHCHRQIIYLSLNCHHQIIYLLLHCHHQIIYLLLRCHHQIIYLLLRCHHQIIYLSLHCHHQIIYLSLHCNHQNDSCIKMGSDESHISVSLIARDKVTRQCPQTTTFLKRRESRSGIKLGPFTRNSNCIHCLYHMASYKNMQNDVTVRKVNRMFQSDKFISACVFFQFCCRRCLVLYVLLLLLILYLSMSFYHSILL